MKIMALAPFPFVGAEFGGGERIENLLMRVQHPIEVLVPYLGSPGRMKAKNLMVTFLPTPDHVRHLEWDLQVSKSAKDVFRLFIDKYDPDLIILEHPWQIDAIEGRPFIYDAHNNETKMKRLIAGEEMIAETERVEKLALAANHVTFCSQTDNLQTDSPKTWIPNGVELPAEPNRTGHKSNVIVFMGSAHPPNIGAAMTLVQLAPVLADYEIVILGKCADFIESREPNVHLKGHVEHETLNDYLLNAHAFINLMGAGSGTSLKVIKAISYGLPVISSQIGARGYEDGCLIAKTGQEVIETLERLKSQEAYKSVSEYNLELARGYSWDVIGDKFNEVIESVFKTVAKR
jgi:glycosyltransferase involved in cell wall biosynthesis